MIPMFVLRSRVNHHLLRAHNVNQLGRVEHHYYTSGTGSLGHESERMRDRLSGLDISEFDLHRTANAWTLDGESTVLKNSGYRVRQLDFECILATDSDVTVSQYSQLRLFHRKVVLFRPGLLCLFDSGDRVDLEHRIVNQFVDIIIRIDTNSVDLFCSDIEESWDQLSARMWKLLTVYDNVLPNNKPKTMRKVWDSFWGLCSLC